MSGDKNGSYRVYAEGLNPTERMAFNGILRLGGRNGVHFEAEATLGRADVFILDGSSSDSIALVRIDSGVAKRAIWIDPPPQVQAPFQVNRPLRWLSVLKMLEQLVGVSGDPGSASAIAQWSASSEEVALERFLAICADVLRKHIGIAAEFVLDDVRAEFESSGDAGGRVVPKVLLGAVQRQLPNNVDAVRVLGELSEAFDRERAR